MKNLIITVIICVSISYIIGVMVGIHITANDIDLPEEINQLSRDKNKPDTLIGYQSNGVIYIGYK